MFQMDYLPSWAPIKHGSLENVTLAFINEQPMFVLVAPQHKQGVAGGAKRAGLCRDATRRRHLHAFGTDALGRNAIFRSNLVSRPLSVCP